MKDVIFLHSAETDLSRIETYYLSISQLTRRRVLDDIFDMISVLQLFPLAGSPQTYNRRHISTTKYRYTISYKFQNDRIEVLGIYRFQDR